MILTQWLLYNDVRCIQIEIFLMKNTKAFVVERKVFLIELVYFTIVCLWYEKYLLSRFQTWCIRNAFYRLANFRPILTKLLSSQESVFILHQTFMQTCLLQSNLRNRTENAVAIIFASFDLLQCSILLVSTFKVNRCFEASTRSFNIGLLAKEGTTLDVVFTIRCCRD